MKRLLLLCAFALATAAAVTAVWWKSADSQELAAVDDPRAAAVLARNFGHGFTASDGKLLSDLIVEKGYKRALDIGTASGYSSIWFALAMRKTGGKVVTLEINPVRARTARENFREAGVLDLIDSRIADALVEIPRLEGAFDFVFMDTGAPLNKRFLDLLYARIPSGGAVTAHNAYSFRLNQRDFLDAIQNDPHLSTRIVPTRSGGISISIKK